MAGGKIVTIEDRAGRLQLCRYGSPTFPGWAVFVYKPDKDGDWKCVKNGKWSEVWPHYQGLIK